MDKLHVPSAEQVSSGAGDDTTKREWPDDADVDIALAAEAPADQVSSWQAATEGEAVRRRWHPLSPRVRDKWHEPAPGPTESTDTWLLSYLDMMTLLLVLMLVMLSLAGQKKADQHAASPEVQAEALAAAMPAPGGRPDQHGLLPGGSGLLPGGDGRLPGMAAAKVNQHGLNVEGLGDDIDVIVTGQSVSFRINSEILFPSGGADLGREGLVLLRQLVPVFGDNDYRVVVHGHTDSVPIGNHRFPSNWELSGARAGSVVRYLQANGLAGSRLSAIGHADTQPMADNATAAGRASNRRVELVVETGADRQP